MWDFHAGRNQCSTKFSRWSMHLVKWLQLLLLLIQVGTSAVLSSHADWCTSLSGYNYRYSYTGRNQCSNKFSRWSKYLEWLRTTALLTQVGTSAVPKFSRWSMHLVKWLHTTASSHTGLWILTNGTCETSMQVGTSAVPKFSRWSMHLVKWLRTTASSHTGQNQCST